MKMAKDKGTVARMNKAKIGLKGGTKPATTKANVAAAAKRAGHGSQTNRGGNTAKVKAHVKGSAKRFK
jgi:hypothetical protein